MSEPWTRGAVTCALASGPVQKPGFTYRGLGLVVDPANPDRRYDRWTVIHLGSGHEVCSLRRVPGVIDLATTIADLGDWTFSGLKGWENMSPDLPAKLRALRARFPEIIEAPASGSQNPGAAVTIALSRLN